MKAERVWYIRTDGEDWKIGRASRLEPLPDKQALRCLKEYCESIGERLIGACRTDDRRKAIRTLYAAFLKWEK